MYIKRAIEDTVIKISKAFPVLLVTDPRQAGKTTLLSLPKLIILPICKMLFPLSYNFQKIF
jgi:predicted AAA+ superfamily ATPase